MSSVPSFFPVSPKEPDETIAPFNVKNLGSNPQHMWHSNIPGGIALPGQVLEVPEEARAGVLKAIEKGHMPKACVVTDDPMSLDDMIEDEAERERQRIPGMKPRRKPVTASQRKK